MAMPRPPWVVLSCSLLLPILVRCNGGESSGLVNVGVTDQLEQQRQRQDEHQELDRPSDESSHNAAALLLDSFSADAALKAEAYEETSHREDVVASTDLTKAENVDDQKLKIELLLSSARASEMSREAASAAAKNREVQLRHETTETEAEARQKAKVEIAEARKNSVLESSAEISKAIEQRSGEVTSLKKEVDALREKYNGAEANVDSLRSKLMDSDRSSAPGDAAATSKVESEVQELKNELAKEQKVAVIQADVVAKKETVKQMAFQKKLDVTRAQNKKLTKAQTEAEVVREHELEAQINGLSVGTHQQQMICGIVLLAVVVISIIAVILMQRRARHQWDYHTKIIVRLNHECSKHRERIAELDDPLLGKLWLGKEETRSASTSPERTPSLSPRSFRGVGKVLCAEEDDTISIDYCKNDNPSLHQEAAIRAWLKKEGVRDEIERRLSPPRKEGSQSDPRSQSVRGYRQGSPPRDSSARKNCWHANEEGPLPLKDQPSNKEEKARGRSSFKKW